jgi:hypothetical protein
MQYLVIETILTAAERPSRMRRRTNGLRSGFTNDTDRIGSRARPPTSLPMPGQVASRSAWYAPLRSVNNNAEE